MKHQTVFSAPRVNSTSYAAFLNVVQQNAADGQVSILDLSVANNPAYPNAGTTYAALLATNNWLTCTSATTATTTGKGVSFLTTASKLWDMAANKSLILAFRVKTGNNAVNTGTGTFCGNSGFGTVPGFTIIANGINGRPVVTISDGTHTYNSGSVMSSMTDGLEHTLVFMMDGTNKKLYTYMDGVATSTVGFDISAITGTTAGTFPLSFGHAGNPSGHGTWDSGSSPANPSIAFRGIHYIVMGSFPSNFNQIAMWLCENQNIFNQIPTALLP